MWLLYVQQTGIYKNKVVVTEHWAWKLIKKSYFRPQAIDDGFLSRFGAQVHIPLPNDRKKIKYFIESFRTRNVHVDQDIVKKFVSLQCDQYSLRECETIVNNAIISSLFRVVNATHFKYIDEHDKYFHCECDSDECDSIFEEYSTIVSKVGPASVLMPEVFLIDLEQAASKVIKANSEEMINDNIKFSEGITRHGSLKCLFSSIQKKHFLWNELAIIFVKQKSMKAFGVIHLMILVIID